MQPNPQTGGLSEERPQNGGGLSKGQKALGIMRSIAGILHGAAYSAGVSGAAQNPWAGPQALAQLREHGVRQQMHKMQMIAYQEKQRRQAMLMKHMQENFGDMSTPEAREGAISYLVSQGAFDFANRASDIFGKMYGTPAETQQFERLKELEGVKSGYRREEAAFEAGIEAKIAAGEPPDYTDVSKMSDSYGKRGGAVFKDLSWANGRIKAAHNLYLNADRNTEEGRAAMAQAYQAMNVALNKLLDPGSVVRESEFARTATYQSLESKAKTFLEQFKTGAVNPAVMEGIAAMGEALYRQGAEQQIAPYENYSAMATRYFKESGVEDVMGGWEDPRAALEQLGAGQPDAQPLSIVPDEDSGITITPME